MFPTSVLDTEFSEEVQEHRNPALDIFMKAVSWFGYMPYSLYIVLFAATVLFLFRYRREALFALLTLISGVISHFTKILFNRPRPTESLVHIIEKARHQSFPSGHVLFYVVFFGFMGLLMYLLKDIPKKLRLTIGMFSTILIFTVPFSRVYLGAHWFTDVVGGFLLGIIYLSLLTYLYLRNRPKN
jgi:undecaprenyl-diphosphatase